MSVVDAELISNTIYHGFVAMMYFYINKKTSVDMTYFCGFVVLVTIESSQHVAAHLQRTHYGAHLLSIGYVYNMTYPRSPGYSVFSNFL